MKKLFAALFVLLLAATCAHATITDETTRIKYSCNGSTVAFTYPFRIIANTDLKVIKTDSANVDTTMVLASDYNVTGAGSATGGTVTLTSASKCTTGNTLTLMRNMPIVQVTHYTEGSKFPASANELSLDKLAMEIQQLKEIFNRTPKLNDSDSTADLRLPKSGSRVLGWDAAGTNLTTYSTTPVYSASIDTIGNHGTIYDAVTDIGAGEETLYCDSTITLTSDLTVPANILFVANNGCMIDNAGFALTINNFTAGQYKTFTGSGLVTLAGNPINPYWFGTDADALSKALDAVISAGGTLFIPPGTLTVSDTTGLLTKTGITKNITIIGDSKATSILRFTGTNGISLTASDSDVRIVVKNLWLQAGYAGTDNALYIEKPYAATLSQDAVEISNLTVGPNVTDQATDYFVNGIVLKNIWHPVVQNCFIRGKTNDVSGMQKGIWLKEQCTSSKLNYNYIYFADKGIYANGVTDYSEGVHVDGNIIVYTNEGVTIDSGTTAQPGHTIVNSHFNTFNYGVNISYGTQSTIMGNVFYKRGESTADHADILLYHTINSRIIGNSASQLGTSGTDSFVRLQNGSNNNIISNNTVSSRDYGVFIDVAGGASPAASIGNNVASIMSAQPKAGFLFIKDDTINSERNYWNSTGAQARYAQLTSTVTKSIPDSVYTTLDHWDTDLEANTDETWWVVGSPSKLTVQKHTSRVKVTAKVSWAVNSTGIRIVQIKKNGTLVAQSIQNAANSSDQSATTGWIVVSTDNAGAATAADYFEVVVYQTSTGALNVSSGGTTTFTIEVSPWG